MPVPKNRRSLGSLASFLAPAQEWIQARLEKSPRHLEWVQIKHGRRAVNCFVACSEVKDKAPAVVAIHETFGLTDWVRGVAGQLAEAGYIATTPDPLSGPATVREFMRAGEAPDANAANKKARDADRLRWKDLLKHL